MFNDTLQQKNIQLKSPNTTSFGENASDIHPITIMDTVLTLYTQEAYYAMSPEGKKYRDLTH